MVMTQAMIVPPFHEVQVHVKILGKRGPVVSVVSVPFQKAPLAHVTYHGTSLEIPQTFDVNLDSNLGTSSIQSLLRRYHIVVAILLARVQP